MILILRVIHNVVPSAMNKEQMIDIRISIDASGSIRDHDTNAFQVKSKVLVDPFGQYRIPIWSFDTKCYNRYIYT